MARALKRAEPAKARPGGDHVVAARAVVRLSRAPRRPSDMDWYGRVGAADDEFDDDFFADLRDALDDPQPLGPRDEPVTPREPVSYELFASSPPAADGAVEGTVEAAVGPAVDRGVGRGVGPAVGHGVGPAVGLGGWRLHATAPSWRDRIVHASRWIRNASAVVLAADLLTLARHVL